MFNKDYEVVIRDQLAFLKVDIYIIDRGNSKLSIAKIEDGQLVFVEYENGAFDPPPTLSMPAGFWDVFKAKIIDKKVRDKNEVEAELKATKFHLEDLRTLLKLKTNYVISGQEIKKEGR
jgi:hypothetical protein